MYKNIKTLNDVDILVIGGGFAGCIAAIAAASAQKYKVLLVERYGFPGGTSTQMLDTFDDLYIINPLRIFSFKHLSNKGHDLYATYTH